MQVSLDVFHTIEGSPACLEDPLEPSEEGLEGRREGRPAGRSVPAARASTPMDPLGQPARLGPGSPSPCSAMTRHERGGEKAKAALELFRPDGQLNDRAWAEARVSEALPALAGKAWTTLRHLLQSPKAFTFLDRLHAELGQLPIESPLREALVRLWWLRRRARQGRRRPACQGDPPARGPLLEAGPRLAAVVQQVAGTLARRRCGPAARWSRVNSVLRMHQSRHRNLGPRFAGPEAAVLEHTVHVGRAGVEASAPTRCLGWISRAMTSGCYSRLRRPRHPVATVLNPRPSQRLPKRKVSTRKPLRLGRCPSFRVYWLLLLPQNPVRAAVIASPYSSVFPPCFIRGSKNSHLAIGFVFRRQNQRRECYLPPSTIWVSSPLRSSLRLSHSWRHLFERHNSASARAGSTFSSPSLREPFTAASSAGGPVKHLSNACSAMGQPPRPDPDPGSRSHRYPYLLSYHRRRPPDRQSWPSASSSSAPASASALGLAPAASAPADRPPGAVIAQRPVSQLGRRIAGDLRVRGEQLNQALQMTPRSWLTSANSLEVSRDSGHDH